MKEMSLKAVLLACAAALLAWGGFAETLQVKSPDGRIVIGFTSDAKGMSWTLSRKGKTLVEPSRLGLVCIDERTFKVLWNAPVEEAMLVTVPYERPPHRQLASVPVFWKGLVWATCQDGALYAWDPETGERRRRVFTGAPYLASAAVSDDGLYAVDYTGRVRCFR